MKRFHKLFRFFLGVVFAGGVAQAQLPHSPYSFEAYQSDLYGESFVAEKQAKYYLASISAGVRYDDNIFLTNGDEESDVIYHITPSITLNNGGDGSALNTVELRYTPSFQFYTDNTDNNSVDQNVELNYGLNHWRTRIMLTLGYTNASGSDRYSSGFFERETYYARVGVDYSLSEKTRLNFNAGSSLEGFDTGGLLDTDSYYTDLTWFYKYSPKLDLGLTLGHSGSLVSDNADHRSYRIGPRINYNVTQKTTIDASGGYEFRDFSSASSSESDWFVNVGASHRLSDYTSMRASIYRNSNSALNEANSGFVASGASFTMIHALTAKTYATGTVAYENDDYFSVGENGVDFDNNYWLLSLGLNHNFSNGLTVGLFTRFQTQSSDTSSQEFDNFSCGVNASYNLW